LVVDNYIYLREKVYFGVESQINKKGSN